MRNRPGVTLTELIIALALFSTLLAVTLGFYREQGQAFTEGNERMTLMQNLRYGVNTLEQQLRTAGIGVPSKQPVIVYADEDVVAFNADYGSNIAGDFFAVYADRRLPSSATTALTPQRAITIPGTSVTYPDSAYYAGSGNSPAETIIFFFASDATTSRSDDYTLYRQVNDLAPDVVARGLLRTDVPFFTYYVLEYSGSGSPVTEVPASYLPGAHTVPIHGAPGDTGLVAGVDSIRAIRVAYAATNGRTGSREALREIRRLIRLPNTGLSTERSCGNVPLLGVGLAASGVPPTSTTAGHIQLQWNRGVDEYTGERDILRYVIWRRRDNSEVWSDPLTSVAPGSASYSYRDFSAEVDKKYYYALSAQDCTPQYSPRAVAGPVEWKR